MKKIKTVQTHSREETYRFAKRFAQTLKPGVILALSGDLGSGKTSFVKGFASGAGYPRQSAVKSPTFVLMHLYRGKCPIYHFDLYRLESMQDLEAIGFQEFINDPEAFTCVEWAEKAPELLSQANYWIEFKHKGENDREISVYSQVNKSKKKKAGRQRT